MYFFFGGGGSLLTDIFGNDVAYYKLKGASWQTDSFTLMLLFPFDKKVTVNSLVLLLRQGADQGCNWVTPSELHTPPVEDFRNM